MRIGIKEVAWGIVGLSLYFMVTSNSDDAENGRNSLFETLDRIQCSTGFFDHTPACQNLEIEP